MNYKATLLKARNRIGNVLSPKFIGPPAMVDYPLAGAGMLIWILSSVLPIARLIEALQRANIKWVCFKVLSGTIKLNQLSGDPELKEIIAALKAAGIRVGGWQWIYTSNVVSPGRQAAALGERYQKLGLEFLFVDVEERGDIGSLWKTGATRSRDADIYVNGLRGGIPLTVPILFCSYRFPYLHPEVPYKNFLRSKSVTDNGPQVYWIWSKNPREQLRESLAQYDDWGKYFRYTIPIGAAFKEHGWVVTTEQIIEFSEAAVEFGCPGYGFWSLDQAINRPDWLDAIGGVTPPDPIEDPDPDPDPEPGQIYEVTTNKLNIRLSANDLAFNDVGDLLKGVRVMAFEIIVNDEGEEWIRFGDNVFACVKQGNYEFMKPVM